MIIFISTQLNNKIPSFTTGNVVVYREDCNTITTAGLYNQLIGDNAINGPGFYAYVLVFAHVNTNLTQIAIGYNTDKIALRHRYNDVWSAWRTI